MLNFRQVKKKIWVLLALFSLLTQNLLPFYSLLPNAVYAEDAVVVEEQIPTEPIQEEQVPVEPTQEEQIQEAPISENNIVASDEVNEEVSVPEETPTPTETEEVLGEQVSNDVEEQTEENQENNNSPPEEENTEEEILDVVILNNVAAPSLDLGAFESEASATLATDKADYAPTDTAIISGSGFNAGATYTLVITSEDEPPTKTEAQVTADESGTFTYAYQLDGIYRPNYKVEAKDSSGNIVAIITFTDSPVSGTTIDSGGLDDINAAQKDLTKMSVDYANHPTSINITWNWDKTGFTGANTGDACSLFDTDGDGLVNTAVCVGVSGNPAAEAYTDVYSSCGDTSNTNCTNPTTAIIPVNTTCSTSITADDPFVGGESYPNDTKASCTIDLSEIGGVNTELVDVCSYPSRSRTSSADDCIVFKDNSGKLEVKKDLIPSNNSGLFNLQIDGSTAGTGANVGDAGTTGEQVVTGGSAQNPTNHTVGETAGTGTNLSDYASSMVCKDLNGTGATVASSNNSGPLTVPVITGSDIVCTITNTLRTATITVNKTLSPSTDPGLFNLQINGSTVGTGENVGDGGTTGVATVSASIQHTVSEIAGTGTNLSDYTTTYSCNNTLSGSGTTIPTFSVTANQNVVCTFTNTRNTGSVKVNKKVDSGSGFVDANPGSFTWSLDTVGTNAMGSTVSGVNTGSHNVNENTVTDYHFVGWYPTVSTQYSCASPQGTTLPVSVSVSANTTTDITLCNAIDTGTVTVYKDVQGPSGESVTDASNNFKVSLDGGTGQDITDNLTVTYNNVPVGSHTITESLVDTDYTLYGISSVAGGAGNTSGLTINVTTGTNNIYVTNRQKSGTITVIKDVVNPDGGAVSDTHSFTVNLTPGSQSSPFAEGDNAVFTVNPGTYTASESADADYTDLGCLTATGKTDIVVGSGGSVTITCTNQQKKATIDVIKDVLSPTSGAISDNHAFTARLNGGLDQSFSEATTASYLVNPGSYSITELADNNYDYVSCMPDSNQTAGDGAQVTVGSNGSVTVTCTNKQKNAQVTVVKDVRNPNGSDVSDSTNFVVQRDGSGTDDKTFREGLNAVYTLVPGTYTFAELVTAGYTLNSINPDNDVNVNNGTTITLNSGQNVTITFTNYQNAGSISGQKLSDTDGVLGTTNDQSNLVNWVIELYTCTSNFTGCALSTSDTTDSSGYSFLNLVPGYYQVKEVLQAGWTALTSLFQNVTVDPGENETGKNFVNFDNVSVTACKKIDADGNIATTGDQTPAYWEMTLLVDRQASGGAQFTDRTTGCYTWTDLGPGHTYGVSEATPTGWTTLTDTTHSFGAAVGGSDYTYTFVNFENVSISGYKWNDLDGDGEWDDGEPTLEDWEINLNGDEQTTTTDGDGYYEFTDLGPGAYTISEENQTGWTQTYPEDPDTHSVTVESGQNVEDKDFGNFRLGQIYGFKYSDINGNGVWNEGEDGINDWEICLDNEDWEGEEWCVDTYDSKDYEDGYFEFTDLEYGDYVLTEDSTNSDYQQTQPESGSYNILIESGSGFGEGDARYFGNAPLNEIFGFKWNDENGNEGRDEGEDLLGNWTIFLDENGNEQLDEGEERTTTEDNTSSDNFGRYRFNSIFPGEYSICEVQQSGWIQKYPFSDFYDEEEDDFTTTNCHHVTLPSDDEQSGYNFGNQEVDPILEISKVNNTGGADKSTGSEVVYTITLEVTENDAEDVTVTDLLPEGFTYKGGSWQVLVNGLVVAVPEPVYASPGTWLLGNLNKDDIVELIYTAVISSSQEQGLYKDLAWGKAEGSTILALAQPTGYVAENFVGTQVNVVKSESSSINIEKKVEGEVLGAATAALPATGGNTLHAVIAILMLVFGLNLLYAGYIIRKRYV